MSDDQMFFLTVTTSAALGALIAWQFARLYYKKKFAAPATAIGAQQRGPKGGNPVVSRDGPRQLSLACPKQRAEIYQFTKGGTEENQIALDIKN